MSGGLVEEGTLLATLIRANISNSELGHMKNTGGVSLLITYFIYWEPYLPGAEFLPNSPGERKELIMAHEQL